MAINLSDVQWDAPPKINPADVRWDGGMPAGRETPMSEVGSGFVRNLIPSTIQQVKGLVQAVATPSRLLKH